MKGLAVNASFEDSQEGGWLVLIALKIYEDFCRRLFGHLISVVRFVSLEGWAYI
jgi:hypothetical protein